MGFKGHWRGPTWIRLFVNMLGMMYDGCLDGAHLDKLFLKHIFLNFFCSMLPTPKSAMLGPAFFPTKKTNKTKQTKTKLNINRDIKEHNNNTRIYQYHGLGPLQRQKYPKSEQFQPNHSLGDFQQFCQKKSPRNVDIAPSM